MAKINLKTYKLGEGLHAYRKDGMCAMEFVAYLNGEPHSDRPQCASPVLTSFVIRLNDHWNDKERQLLKPFLKRIIGTRDEKDAERARVLTMGVANRVVPLLLKDQGLIKDAKAMRAAKTLNDADRAINNAIDNINNTHIYMYNVMHTAAHSVHKAIDTCYYKKIRLFNSVNYPASIITDACEYNTIRKAVIKEALKLLDKVLKL